MPRWSSIPPQERFWQKVHKTDTCWIWLGAKLPKGYGVYWPNATKRIYAHRFSFELVNGLIPFGLSVLHSCDNPSCVNPAHLSVGTAKDNTADMIAKGRKARVNNNTGKTHCKHGHQFSPENTRIDTRGRRQCRACGKIWDKAKRTFNPKAAGLSAGV